MGRSAIFLFAIFVISLVTLEPGFAQPSDSGGAMQGLGLVRGVRLLALAGIVLTWIPVGQALANGTRSFGFTGGIDRLSSIMFALTGVVAVSEGIEAVFYGIQPPIFFVICVPLFWIGVIGAGLLGGCTSPNKPAPEPQPAPVPTPEPVPTPAPPPESQDPCVSDVVHRDSGPTHNGRRFTDFTKVEQGGVEYNFFPLASSPSGANQLGLVEGTYPGTQVNGFYKKVEVEITTTAPCTIVSVSRTRQTLSGHNIPNPQPDGDDGPDESRSVDKISDQRWIVTDAPGFALREPDLSYYKRFTVTAKFRDAAGNEFTKSASYTVLVRLDALFDLISNPTPP